MSAAKFRWILVWEGPLTVWANYLTVGHMVMSEVAQIREWSWMWAFPGSSQKYYYYGASKGFIERVTVHNLNVIYFFILLFMGILRERLSMPQP